MRYILTALLALMIQPAFSQWSLDVETGLPFPGYNDVRIPNETGTEFSFTDDFELKGTVIPFRLQVGFTFFERNHLFALFAPLSIQYEGTAPYDIYFQNSLFEEGAYIDGLYKFNSYRLTYRRDLIRSEKWVFGLGFTAKIRDARVRLTTDGITDAKNDIGFVPLLNLHLAYKPGDFSVRLDGDGLAGGPGRAFDISLVGTYALTPNLHLKAGYRFLEGGADIDEVYNFTLINFAIAGFIWNLGNQQ
jgi:hypothetical protein